jgi:hypothetical protein
MTEFYSTLKRKNVMIVDMSQKNLENIMLSKRNQPQDTRYCVIVFIQDSSLGKFTETENRLVVAKGEGGHR